MPASLVEIFASFQGEGIYVGAPTIFVRFGGCDLRCRWCDSAGTWSTTRECRIEDAAGSGRFGSFSNPLPIEDIVGALDRLGLERFAFVSATGGEPLLQAAAVGALGEALQHSRARFWLETHGLHAAALAGVIDRVDVVSMDWKLPGEVKRASGSNETFVEQHQAFLRVALKASECIVKIVVTPQTRDVEWEEACRAIASIAPEIPFIVQPVTPVSNPLGSVEERPSAARLMDLQQRAEEHLRMVRIIPQTHPLLGAL